MAEHLAQDLREQEDRFEVQPRSLATLSDAMEGQQAMSAQRPVSVNRPATSRAPAPKNAELYKEFENCNSLRMDLPRSSLKALMMRRELGDSLHARRRSMHRVQMMDNFLPTYFRRFVAQHKSAVYGGCFSADGSKFISCVQDRHIYIYDTNIYEDRPWRLSHRIRVKRFKWTIADFDMSPDQRLLAHASLTSDVNLEDLNDRDRSRLLDFDCRAIYGLKFTADGKEIIAGIQSGSIRVFNLERNEVTLDVANAHTRDVNSVCLLDESGHILVSGSDDKTCKVWDRRNLRNGSVCVSQGHRAGITYVNPKGDGRYFISNSKDNSINLWDIRKPGDGRTRSGGGDNVMSYRGHKSELTLVRARFSPLESTAQRYIYSASSTGDVYIYETLTGKVAHVLRGHVDTVRDVSWHPTQPLLCSSSWDGSVVLWGPRKNCVPNDDIYSDFRITDEYD